MIITIDAWINYSRHLQALFRVSTFGRCETYFRERLWLWDITRSDSNLCNMITYRVSEEKRKIREETIRAIRNASDTIGNETSTMG